MFKVGDSVIFEEREFRILVITNLGDYLILRIDSVHEDDFEINVYDSEVKPTTLTMMRWICCSQ